MADSEFRIESDSPVAAELMFWRIVGHEALARPSFYELTVLSTHADLGAKDILGRAFDVVIEFFDADGGRHERHCQGHAARFSRVGMVGRHAQYRIVLRSWFWLLTKRTNSRILQDKPVLEVLDAVFEDSPIKRFKKTAPDKVIGTHKPRRYCVQHLESDYQYLSRLLEDEGIYYWFDAHDAPGTMHLADASDIAHEKLPVTDTLVYAPEVSTEARFNEISHWVSARQFDTGKHAARDTDFKAINRKLGADIDAADDHELADFEVFEFPGGYFSGEDAEATAKVRAEELGARRDRFWALTAWPDVAAGRSFTFQGGPDGLHDGDYLIAGCTFVVSHPGYESLQLDEPEGSLRELLHRVLAEDAVNADTLDMLEELLDRMPLLRTGVRGASAFLLTLLPSDMPFRPPRLTPRVLMPGPQTAIVVGGKGKEHDVDEFGRVKVHFLWDRYDQSDDKSTCWVRVSQPWAGKGWGGYFAPRIGQEVIVDFIGGNPDRPIVMGRVYNDAQEIPYKSATQSGFRTRSTPGGGPSNYNELMFEDKKGAEVVSIHAERNMSTSVEVDDSTSVGNDQSETVDRDRTALVKRNEKNTVAEIQTNVVGISQSNQIGAGGQKTQVKGFQENIYYAGQKTSVVGMQGLLVTANQDIAIGGFQKIVVGANMDVGVVGFQTTSVGSDCAFIVTGNTKVQSGGERNDVTSGKHAIMANQIKLVSNTTIDMMAVGDINATSVGSNTTVLGSNSSGYIGSNSEATLGMNRSSFIGLSMSNALAMDISNFAGLQMENTAAAKIANVAALSLSQNTIDVDMQTMKVIGPGSGAGAAAGGGLGGAIAGAILGGGALIFGAFDMKATFDQYEKARKDLKDAAAEAQAQGLTGLASRLTRLSRIAERRRTEGVATAVGGPIWAAGLAGAEVLGGTAGARSADAIGKEAAAAAGAAAARPAAPVIPAPPAMPPGPPPYTPPAGSR